MIKLMSTKLTLRKRNKKFNKAKRDAIKNIENALICAREMGQVEYPLMPTALDPQFAEGSEALTQLLLWLRRNGYIYRREEFFSPFANEIKIIYNIRQ